jgi:diguanylate cyclase (GGDEF)-like protein
VTIALAAVASALGTLVVVLLAQWVAQRRRAHGGDEHFAQAVERLESRLDRMANDLHAALEQAQAEGRKNRQLGELAGTIDLDEVLTRVLQASGAIPGADAALVALTPATPGGQPIVATLGLSNEEAERHAVTGPPDGSEARAISVSYEYSDGEHGAEEPIRAGIAVPLPGENTALGLLTIFTRSAKHRFGEDEVRELEELALRAGPAVENARRFREARQLADLDALTGLHNRRYFHETLAREVARAHRYQRNLALIIFDLDDFKAINDHIGHLAGDAVLAEAAERVREVVRSADIACRVGGDEFAVILPESRRADADQHYARLQKAVSARCASRPASPSCARTTTRSRSSSAQTMRCTARRRKARARSWRRR